LTGLTIGGFVTNISSISRDPGLGGAQHFPNSTPVRANAAAGSTPYQAGRPDQVNLQNPVNPYAGFANEAARVTVDRWKQGPNDSIEHMLLRQGYTPQDVYRKDSSGRTLIQRVADANGLKDPNLVRPGRKMLVPVKGDGQPARPLEIGQQPQVRQQPELRQESRQQAAPQPQQPEVRPEEVRAQEVRQPEVLQPTTPPVTPEAAPAAEPPAAEQGPVKKGRRRFILFGPRREVKAPQVQPTAVQPPTVQPNAVPSPPVQSTPVVPTQVPQADQDSAEVGLLLQGVKDQKFTRPEFQALNSTANQFTELRAQYARDGFKPEQVQELAQVQQQYGQMYARFLADDKARVTFSGANTNTPEAQFRARQNEEGGQAYDQFIGRQIDEATIRARLLTQRQQASQLGVQK
jgi:hypothetical protein